MGASLTVLYLSFRVNGEGGRRAFTLKGLGALIMGAPIVGMHYVGMWATDLTPTRDGGAFSDLDRFALGVGIGLVTLLVLGLVFIASFVDQRFTAQAEDLRDSEDALRESEESRQGPSNCRSDDRSRGFRHEVLGAGVRGPVGDRRRRQERQKSLQASIKHHINTALMLHCAFTENRTRW